MIPNQTWDPSDIKESLIKEASVLEMCLLYRESSVLTKDEDNTFHLNVSIYLRDYAVSQPRIQ